MNVRRGWFPVRGLVVALLMIGACRRQKNGAVISADRLALVAPDTARANLVAEVVIPNAQRTLGTVEALAKKLGLPMTASDARKTMIARSNLPETAVNRLDLEKPAALIILAAPATKPVPDAGADAPPALTTVIAFALRDPSPAGFDAFVATLGQVAVRKADAIRLDRGDGGATNHYWLLARDGAVCLADSIEALTAGGALALAARTAKGEDVNVHFLPDGYARANQTTVTVALAKAKEELARDSEKFQAAQQEALAGSKAPSAADAKRLAANNRMTQAIGGAILALFGDVAAVDGTAALDEKQGLTTTIALTPHAGSGLALHTAKVTPYAFDPAFSGSNAVLLGGFGSFDFGRAVLALVEREILPEAATTSERTRASALIEEIAATFAGPMSLRLGLASGANAGFEEDVSYDLRPGVDQKKLLANIDELSRAPLTARLLAWTGNGYTMKLSSRREGDALVLQTLINTKKMNPAVRAQLKTFPLFDGKPLETRVAVMGDRLRFSVGGDVKTRFQAMRATPAAPSPDLTQALDATKGADGVVYADLAALLRAGLGALQAAGSQGPSEMSGVMTLAGVLLGDARLATFGSYRGGDRPTLTWRLPLGTFETIGQIVRKAMGLSGAAAAPAGNGAP